MGDLSPYYSQLLADQHLVLLCDALNEMPRMSGTGQKQRDLLAEVRQTLKDAPLFVVSCRVRDYHSDLDDLKLERLEVREMELPAIREFVRRYRLLMKYEDVELWRQMGGDDEHLFAFWKQVRDKDEGARFWDEGAGIPSYTSSAGDRAWRNMWTGAKLIPLARNPYMAKVVCSLHGRKQMPENRADLYRAFVDDLYQREARQAAARGQTFVAQAALEGYLTDLANRMQAAQTTVLRRGDGMGAAELLQAALDATLLTLEGDDLRFSHQLLQEYFAARTLLAKLNGDEDPALTFGETGWNIALWRETANMLIDFTRDPLRVMLWIARGSLPLALEVIEQHALPLEGSTRQVLLEQALSKRDDPHPIGRAAAYRVLGLLQADDRPGVGVGADGLPDIEWCEVNDDHEWKYQNEKRPALPPYQIARYPISYRQFQAFIDAPDGWNDDRWWKGLAANERHKAQPEEQWFKVWNHPRETVSWYDAIAFCRWLSHKLGGGYALDQVSEWAVRLPTEQEWERAARGTDERIYPYGDTFDATKGNTIETGIGQTSAVGIFPDGVSPAGAQDMSGNVWEWCLTDYENPAADATGENLSSDARRVVRGGSWGLNLDLARASIRVNAFRSIATTTSVFGFCVPFKPSEHCGGGAASAAGA